MIGCAMILLLPEIRFADHGCLWFSFDLLAFFPQRHCISVTLEQPHSVHPLSAHLAAKPRNYSPCVRAKTTTFFCPATRPLSHRLAHVLPRASQGHESRTACALDPIISFSASPPDPISPLHSFTRTRRWRDSGQTAWESRISSISSAQSLSDLSDQIDSAPLFLDELASLGQDKRR